MFFVNSFRLAKIVWSKVLISRPALPWRLALALLFLSSIVPVARSQVSTASVNGFITDSSGAAVPGTTVTIKEVHTGYMRSASTNSLGGYSILAIPAGDYTFTVRKEGFETIVQAGQTITQQLAARIDFALKVGSVHQTVTVRSAPPLLQTESPSNAVTLSQQTITALPTLGHNYLQTAILSPGVTPLAGGDMLTVVEGNAFTNGVQYKPVSVDVSGGSSALTGFVEDGFDARDPNYGGSLFQMTPEAISSFRIVRGFDSVQYGGEPSVIYVSTKSGTNQYHGSLWEYHQDASLQTRQFNIPTVPALTYNQPGGTIGGPLLPQLKNKTFFFFSFQTTRVRSTSPSSGVVPTAAEWGGDLSAIPVQIYNPFDIDTATNQRRPFPNNQIPSSLLSLMGQKFKQYVPLPTVLNAAYGAPNFFTSTRNINDDTQYLIRVDQVLPHGGRMFAKWFRDKDNSISYGITPESGIYNPLRGQTGDIEWDQPLAPNKLNTLRVSIYRSVGDFGGIPTSQNIGQILGLKNTIQEPLYWGLPSINITGITTPGTLVYTLHQLTTRWEISDDFSMVHNRHTLDFGFVSEPTQYPQSDGALPRGLISYTGSFTTPSPSFTGPEIGLADFLLGAFANGQASNLPFDPVLSAPYWGAYAQDQIKVNKKLTLTLGARWDYWEPPTERYNRNVAFDQNTGKIAFVLKDPFAWRTNHTTLSGDIPRGMFENWKKDNFSPRIGIAYLLTPNTTLRGGFGIYYSQGMMNFQIFSSVENGAPPFATLVSPSNDVNQLAPQELDTQLFPPPQAGQLTPGLSFISPDIHAPQSHVQQVTLSVQRQLGENMLASIGYNGSFGRHMFADFNINQASLFDPNNPLPLNQRRPYPFFSDILIQGNESSSSYNALALHFEKRFSSGVSLIANYTWGQALDVFSLSSGGIENQNAHCLKCDYGPADYNRTNYFSLGYIWKLPIGANERFVNHGPASKILADWQWSGITQFMSGAPISPGVPITQANVDALYGVIRPNRVCSGELAHPTLQEFFNTSCFPLQPPNTFGNSGRNVIIGPGSQLWDMAIGRTFTFREGIDFNVRGEFYSVFNHQNWGSPDSGVLDPTFGQIFTKSNNRVVQLGMKLTF